MGVLVTIIAALGAFVVSLITRARARLEAKFEVAKSAAIQIEQSPAAQAGVMKGADKLNAAVAVAMEASSKTGRFAAMTEAEATRMVEKALPTAIRESLRPPPPGSG